MVKLSSSSGTQHLSTYLKIYKVGDIVDVKVKQISSKAFFFLNISHGEGGHVALWASKIQSQTKTVTLCHILFVNCGVVIVIDKVPVQYPPHV